MSKSFKNISLQSFATAGRTNDQLNMSLRYRVTINKLQNKKTFETIIYIIISDL